ncbi:Endolysin, partial [Pseudolycoriella hygida]
KLEEFIEKLNGDESVWRTKRSKQNEFYKVNQEEYKDWKESSECEKSTDKELNANDEIERSDEKIGQRDRVVEESDRIIQLEESISRETVIGSDNELTAVNKSESLAYKGPTTIAGLNLIIEHECFHSNFYFDTIGNKMIGYGSRCDANLCDKLRPPITVAQATNLLKTQLQEFECCVNQYVKYTQLNAAQFSSLVSFSSDLGCETLKGSILLRKLNKGDISGVSAEFAKWNRKSGKIDPALTKRRAAERELFCTNKCC